jgi:hypothetical protein
MSVLEHRRRLRRMSKGGPEQDNIRRDEDSRTKTKKVNKLRILRKEIKSNMEERNSRENIEEEEEDGKKKMDEETKLCKQAFKLFHREYGKQKESKYFSLFVDEVRCGR